MLPHHAEDMSMEELSAQFAELNTDMSAVVQRFYAASRSGDIDELERAVPLIFARNDAQAMDILKRGLIEARQGGSLAAITYLTYILNGGEESETFQAGAYEHYN